VAKYKELLASRPDFYTAWASLAMAPRFRRTTLKRTVASRVHGPRPDPERFDRGAMGEAYVGYFEGRWDSALAESRTSGKLLEELERSLHGG